MARAGAVVTNSAATAQRLRDLYAVGGIQGLGDGILEVIPNGVTRPETLAGVCAGMDLAVEGNVFGLDESLRPTLADMRRRPVPP